MLDWLGKEGIPPSLCREIMNFRERYPSDLSEGSTPAFFYYGKEIWEEAICGILAGKNLLLAGPKATGKNVLAENLACAFGRKSRNVSFHVNVDASYLIGTDTFDGEKVVFRPGPVCRCAVDGGFGILDEINMAKNEAMAVLHSVLDHRRIMEISGYDTITLHPACRFIGTMNYGYVGTRELNEALASRFVVLQMPTIREEQLIRLLKETYPQISENMKTQLTHVFYELDEKAKNAEISSRAVDLRGLLDAVAMMKIGLSPISALDLGITNKVFDPGERDLIHDVIAARIPKSWM